ncbi:MAG: hypothetical protein PHQ52_02385 [Candidatus Omnitrophica bacterium]|nr:hypothetical protein [Candidatus Omnitrophota bacterium]
MDEKMKQEFLEKLKKLSYEEYEDRLICFVDIQGFTNDVKKISCDEDFKNILRLLFVLKETEKKHNAEHGLIKNFQMTTVSDSIIVSMPYKDQVSALALIISLQLIQYEILFSFKKLIRGFFTRGRVYHKEDIIFGEGYCDSYEKEKKVGCAPRIVIDPVIINDARAKINTEKKLGKLGNRDHVFNYLLNDERDDLFFVDYLKPIGEHQKGKREERAEVERFIEENRIKFKDDIKIFRKYSWLNDYFKETEKYFTK